MVQWNNYQGNYGNWNSHFDDPADGPSLAPRKYMLSEPEHPLDHAVLDPTETSDLSSLVNIVGKEKRLLRKTDILEVLRSMGLVTVGSISFKESPFEEHVCVYLTQKGRNKVETLEQ